MSVKNGINGWAGSILRINLTTGTITTEDTLPKYKPYIGGMASATRSSGTRSRLMPIRLARRRRPSLPSAR